MYTVNQTYLGKEAEWIRAENAQDSSPLKRFREENMWITDNWSNLDSVLP